MDVASVRYIVDDVAAAVAFYTDHLGFEVDIDAVPGFAALAKGPLRLLVNATGGSGGASQAMPDGQMPEPGGWNRIQLTVTDLAVEVQRLRLAGLKFRNDLVVGRGGSQILLQDPPAIWWSCSSRLPDRMDVVREFCTAAVRLHVLHHAAQGAVHGAWMIANCAPTVTRSGPAPSIRSCTKCSRPGCSPPSRRSSTATNASPTGPPRRD